MPKYTFQAVSGFFAQDDPSRIPGFSAHGDAELTVPEPAILLPHFGILDRSPGRWTKFFAKIADLNKSAPPGVSYKFFFFARHGEGYHNVAEVKYGKPAWEAHWSKINGDGELVWGPDPELTPLGESQPLAIRKVWLEEVQEGLGYPQKMFASPLTRAMNTCRITWEGIHISAKSTVSVLENCRETNGEHTCDKRRTRSYIEHDPRFVHFKPEPGFTEKDELWDADNRETFEHLSERAGKVLVKIFDEERDKEFVSITGHGGIINGFMAYIGRSLANLGTGGVIPCVIKATRVD